MTDTLLRGREITRRWGGLVAVDDGPVQVWVPGQPEPFFPKGHQFAAHNSFFEWCILYYVLKWKEVAKMPWDWIDTAARAMGATGSSPWRG